MSRLLYTHMEQDFYKSNAWQAMRRAILARDGYLCQHNKRYGRMVQAELVHHIFPRDEYPEYTWETWNLVSLSRAAHNLMHDRTTDKLTEAGRKLLVRTARKQGLAVPDEYKEPVKGVFLRHERSY